MTGIIFAEALPLLTGSLRGRAAIGLGAFALLLILVPPLVHGRRWRYREERRRRDQILNVIAFAAERFLRNRAWSESLPPTLEKLGLAAGAGRVSVRQLVPAEGGEIRVTLQAEWRNPAHASVDPPPLPEIPLQALRLDSWLRVLREDRWVAGPAWSFPAEERALLESRGIRSILILPIWVADECWGGLVFCDLVADRVWSHLEIEVLMVAARMIAAAIERVRAEEALLEAEDRFRQMAENIREVFFLIDAQTREVLYLSPAYEEVWGRSRDEIIANPLAFADSILPEDRHLMLANVQTSVAGEGPRERQHDYRIQRPDGSIRWIRNRSVQIFAENGRPHRVAGVCMDITEQKQMEEQLRQAHRVEAIGHLAAGIAHEINTPIQYIWGNLEFLTGCTNDLTLALQAYDELLRESNTDSVPTERLTEIAATVEAADVAYILEELPRASAQALEGVRRVAEIVTAMKDLSHPGTGQYAPTDLNQAIRNTAIVARNEWKYVADLVTDLAEDLPLVRCLAGEINQVILNLVVNAAHAIADRRAAEGGEGRGRITIATERVGGYVQVRVADTGTGIPADIRPHIFDPFFTTKEVGRGTGQGLTFVHSIIVERHGGTISFETEEGVGTTFFVRLPCRQASADAREAARR